LFDKDHPEKDFIVVDSEDDEMEEEEEEEGREMEDAEGAEGQASVDVELL
jgi:hypothetical protein